MKKEKAWVIGLILILLIILILGITVYSKTDEPKTITDGSTKSYKSDETDETWGITLETENVTATSAIIKCTQSGGAPTGELQTGSWYIVENWTQEDGWKEMPYVIDGEIGWTAEAWMIPMNSEREWEVNWEWLYGQLPAGTYRIGKEIMDFRSSGDYDTAVYYVEFGITD